MRKKLPILLLVLIILLQAFVPVAYAASKNDAQSQTAYFCPSDATSKGAGKTFGPMNPGPLTDDVARTFSGGTYTQKVLTQDTIFYRVHGGDAGKVGSFMSRTPQNGAMQSQIDLAINPAWGNSATSVTKVTVPKGTVIYEGSAASQSINGGAGSLLGGGNQIYIPKGALNSSWFGK